MSYINIAKKGTYYCPAYKHYGTTNDNKEEEINVVCDRCNREKLKNCVGFNNKDLCMACVKDLIDKDDKDNSNDVVPYDKPIKHISLPKRMKPRMFK